MSKSRAPIAGWTAQPAAGSADRTTVDDEHCRPHRSRRSLGTPIDAVRPQQPVLDAACVRNSPDWYRRPILTRTLVRPNRARGGADLGESNLGVGMSNVRASASDYEISLDSRFGATVMYASVTSSRTSSQSIPSRSR